jgi:hypothetical protein
MDGIGKLVCERDIIVAVSYAEARVWHETLKYPIELFLGLFGQQGSPTACGRKVTVGNFSCAQPIKAMRAIKKNPKQSTRLGFAAGCCLNLGF